MNGTLGSVIWIVAMLALLYFMIIRPQKKQQKERETMLSAVKKGDRIVTIGGIYGIVRGMKDDRITLEVANDVYMTFSKSAVSSVLKSGNSNEEAPEAVEAAPVIEEAAPEITIEQDAPEENTEE